MARRTSFQIALDTSLFTPVQLQPTALGRIGFNAGTRWLGEHVCSHRALIAEHRVGLVAWSWQLRYPDRFGFLDADDARVDVEARLRGRGAQLEWNVSLSSPDAVAAEMRMTMVPLELSDDPSLSGAPRRLPDALAGSFEPEEVERAPSRTPVPGMLAELESEGRELASGDSSFPVNRHHCEIADQWFWAEALSFAGGAREGLVTRYAASTPGLGAGLSQPLRSVDVVAMRPYQFRDVARIRTTAYMLREEPVFVHRMELADDPSGTTHALAVERF